MSTIKLGFIGTGTISAAIIKGLCSLKDNPYQIIISPRNAEIAENLHQAYPDKVKIAKTNQEVIDGSEMVFIALRVQVAEDIVRQLVFKDHQKIVNLIATASQTTVSEWIKNACPVLRAVPLPFVEQHSSITPFFPNDNDLQKLFDKLGGGIAVENEKLFNQFMLAGSFMGVYYHFMETCNRLLQENGLDQSQTSAYLSSLFTNLAEQAVHEHDFVKLEKEYSTKGGTNELISKEFTKNGGDHALIEAFNTALQKMIS